jgi:hypothetical protein
MAGIFISYRREDAAGHAGRLCDRLNARLGADRVFMDVEDVRPGEDFVRAIDDTVAASDYLLVVIGPRWLEAMNRRAAPDADFVRHEILAGLRRGTKLVPVLVAGATMPQPSQLPPDLAELSRRNAIEIRDDRFDDDVGRLIALLGAIPGGRLATGGAAHSRRWIAVLALVAIAAIAGYVVFRPAGSDPVPDGSGTGAAPVAVPAPPAPVTGEWVADMQKPPQPNYRIRLTLTQAGKSIGGVVSYPTGDGVIQEGTIDGDAVIFSTSHVPQFETEPAIIRFIGTIEPDGIRLSAADRGGVATGLARRVTAP